MSVLCWWRLSACSLLILSCTTFAEDATWSCPPKICKISQSGVDSELKSDQPPSLTRTPGSLDDVHGLQYRYGFYGHGSQASGNCTCDVHPNVTTWFGRKICNAPLTPSWALAVVIGLFSAYKLLSLGPSVTGSLSYSMTFSMYAVMITSGLFVHCLFLVECGKAPVTQAYVTVAKIDGSLTSCIALSFLYNGLVDLKVIPERAVSTVFSMVLLYSAVFVAYFVELIPGMTLYFLTIIVGCSLYLLCQCVCLLTSHCLRFGFLLLAGMAGGVSLWLYYYHECWLCQTLGAWSIEGVWYYGSDLAMSLVFLYVWNTRASDNEEQAKPKIQYSI